MKKIILFIPYGNLRKDFAARYGLNAYYAGKHWSQRQKDAKYWHAITEQAMNDAGIKKDHKPFTKPVSVKLYWNDKLDLDNHAAMGKMIVDALKGRIIEDDSRKYLASVQHYWHDCPFIKVEIAEFCDRTQPKKEKRA